MSHWFIIGFSIIMPIKLKASLLRINIHGNIKHSVITFTERKGERKSILKISSINLVITRSKIDGIASFLARVGLSICWYKYRSSNLSENCWSYNEVDWLVLCTFQSIKGKLKSPRIRNFELRLTRREIHTRILALLTGLDKLTIGLR